MGEGPVVAVGWASCCSGLGQLLQWVGSVVAVGWFSCCNGLVQLLLDLVLSVAVLVVV